MSKVKLGIPEGVWEKCPGCQEILYKKELEQHHKVCRKCDYHFRLNVLEKLALFIEEGTFKEYDKDLTADDPLNFVDLKAYKDRVKEAKEKTGRSEGILSGEGKIFDQKIVIAIMDFEFLGGSMGSVVGEKIVRAIEKAIKLKLPVIIVSSSGGARMQESILSLMQMAKTSAALAKLSEAGLPYISVLMDPTTGGVTASFAMLGDINIGETNALIAFAGPRVIEQTIRQKLPKGFQRSEFQLEHGMVDIVSHRRDLKNTVANVLNMLLASQNKTNEK